MRFAGLGLYKRNSRKTLFPERNADLSTPRPATVDAKSDLYSLIMRRGNHSRRREDPADATNVNDEYADTMDRPSLLSMRNDDWPVEQAAMSLDPVLTILTAKEELRPLPKLGLQNTGSYSAYNAVLQVFLRLNMARRLGIELELEKERRHYKVSPVQEAMVELFDGKRSKVRAGNEEVEIFDLDATSKLQTCILETPFEPGKNTDVCQFTNLLLQVEPFYSAHLSTYPKDSLRKTELITVRSDKLPFDFRTVLDDYLDYDTTTKKYQKPFEKWPDLLVVCFEPSSSNAGFDFLKAKRHRSTATIGKRYNMYLPEQFATHEGKSHHFWDGGIKQTRELYQLHGFIVAEYSRKEKDGQTRAYVHQDEEGWYEYDDVMVTKLDKKYEFDRLFNNQMYEFIGAARSRSEAYKMQEKKSQFKKLVVYEKIKTLTELRAKPFKYAGDTASNDYFIMVIGLGCSLWRSQLDQLEAYIINKTGMQGEFVCNDLTETLKHIHNARYMRKPSHTSKFVEKVINKVREKLTGDCRVFLLGHSYGGAVANSVAEYFTANPMEEGKNQNLRVATIGSIYIPRGEKDIDPNIKTYNYMLKNDVALRANQCTPGGECKRVIWMDSLAHKPRKSMFDVLYFAGTKDEWKVHNSYGDLYADLLTSRDLNASKSIYLNNFFVVTKIDGFPAEEELFLKKKLGSVLRPWP